MEAKKNICAGMEAKLAELLLDAETVPAAVQAHVSTCPNCSRELEELRATLSLMDAWEAPEPNPYFMTRFQARLAEEKRVAPAGWLERLKARFLFGSQVHVKPLAALALTILVLLGGGTYLEVYWEQPIAAPSQTAVVHDLQTLDNNAQLLDQLASISGDQDPDQN